MSTDYSRLDGTHLDHTALRDLRLAVVGLGAVGGEAVKNLGLTGVGEVLLIDPDTVEDSNLTRGLFYRGHAGEAKAVALADEAARRFPDTRWIPLADEIADVGWAGLRRCDVFLSAVDRDSARLELARIATRLALPVCEAGLSTGQTGRGRVTWYPGAVEAACFGCRLTAARRRELLTTWRSAVHPCGAHGPEPGGWSSTPTLASIIGALLVETALRSWRESQKQSFSLEWEIAPAFTAARIFHARAEDCPFHEPAGELVEAGPGSFASWMNGAAITWEWSLCLAARCLECGWRWSPRLRMARLLRAGACPRCGANRLRMEESLRRMSPGDPRAAATPIEIGLPADHLYTRESSLPAAAPLFEARE
jgi:adenylyltransferase/sulfurtransferase